MAKRKSDLAETVEAQEVRTVSTPSVPFWEKNPKLVLYALGGVAALVAGWLGIAAYLLWLVTNNATLLDFSRSAGIWFFLLPIVMTVSHRMIPFFSSRVLENYVLVRPYWILWLMLACSVGHGKLLLLWDTALPYLWMFDLPLAASALYLSFTWGVLRSFRVHLLAVLHIAFAWLGLSMLMYGAQSLVFFAAAGNYRYLAWRRCTRSAGPCT